MDFDQLLFSACVFFLVFGGTFYVIGIYDWTIHFKSKWFCENFDWHYVTKKSMDDRFDGCSLHSRCTRCGKKVIQDGQGNWF